MFGQQDDMQGQDGEWSSQPANDNATTTTDDTYLDTAASAAGQSPTPDPDPAPPLLEEEAADGTPAASNTDTATPTAPPVAPANDDGLLGIKQQALQQLGPLVNHLDQSPEEKFRTTMMMIQASDNKDLISVAYEAANQIGDEKARAQALLDIVNEINYFTQR